MTEIVFTCAASGADYSSPVTWNTDLSCDLTATTTKIYSHGGITGTLAAGDSLEVNGDAASTATIAGITATQVLLKDIVGTIENADTLQEVGATGNNITLSSVASTENVPVLEFANELFNFSWRMDNSGWTTDATNYPILRPQDGAAHDGTKGSGARIITSPGAGTQVLRLAQHMKVLNLEIDCTQSSGGTAAIQTNNNATVKGCILKTASSSRGALYLGSDATITDNLFIDSANHAIQFNGNFIQDSLVAGNTFINNGGRCIEGFGGGNNDIIVIGNVAHGNGSDFWDGIGIVDASCGHNVTDSADYTDMPGGDNGTNVIGLSATASDEFENPAAGNYAPKAGSAINDAWKASPESTTDAIGTARPQDATADAGYIEVIVGGGGGGSILPIIQHYRNQD